jgi:hypothetical protein
MTILIHQSVQNDDEEYVTILPAQVMDDLGKGLTKIK